MPKVSPAKVKTDVPRHVLIGGEALLYSSKAPYIPSGVSIKGALEYDPEDDTIRCHECGRWMKSLAAHLKVHELSGREYKEKHGLYSSTALVNEKVRTGLSSRAQISIRTNPKIIAAFRKNYTHPKRGPRVHTSFFTGRGQAEGKNKAVLCLPQLKERIIALSKKIGRTPTCKDLENEGLNTRTVQLTFGSIKEAMELCGLIPNKGFATGGPVVYDYSKKSLIGIMRNFFSKHHRYPTASDAKRRLVPPRCVFNRVFGSWRLALNAAGCKGFDYERRFSRERTNEDILNCIRLFYRNVGRIPTLSKKDTRLKEKYRIPGEHIFRNRFGSMRAAIATAGLPVGSGRKFYDKVGPTCFKPKRRTK